MPRPTADAGYTVFAPPPEEEEPADNPPVVAETRVDIPDATCPTR